MRALKWFSLTGPRAQSAIFGMFLMAAVVGLMTLIPGPQTEAAPPLNGDRCPAGCDAECWAQEKFNCGTLKAQRINICFAASEHCFDTINDETCYPNYLACTAQAEADYQTCLSQRPLSCC